MGEKLTKVERVALERRMDAWLDTRFERRREVNQRYFNVVARMAGAIGEDCRRRFYPAGREALSHKGRG